MQCHHVINWPIISAWSRVVHATNGRVYYMRSNRNDWVGIKGGMGNE